MPNNRNLVDTDRLPTSNVPYIWVDYIELLCLINIDNALSLDDFIGRISGRIDLKENENEDEQNDGPDVKNDKRRQDATDWFTHLEYREKIFRNYYPFKIEVSAETRVIYRKKKLTQKMKLYIFLLMSSNLRYIHKSKRATLTSCFEYISAEALKSYLPEKAKVYVFGKNKMNRGRKYSGKLWDKLNILANDLKEEIIVKEKEFSPHDTGDNGLDVVGWVPFFDNEPGFFLILAQCACTENWIDKQHTTSISSWNQIMTFTTPLNNVVFIPFCFRNSFGNWHKKHKIHNSILIDRVRLADLLIGKQGIIQKVLPFEIIEKTYLQKENIV